MVLDCRLNIIPPVEQKYEYRANAHCRLPIDLQTPPINVSVDRSGCNGKEWILLANLAFASHLLTIIQSQAFSHN